MGGVKLSKTDMETYNAKLKDMPKFVENIKLLTN
jgi:hypothetical protein